MDFKKAYKEALERAKKGMPINEVFPELKESEDERIRKRIKEIINEVSRHKEFLDMFPDLEKCYDWLEKMKEPKPNPYTGTGFDYNGHHLGMCARDGGVEIIVDGKIRNRVSFESENIEWSNSVAKEMFVKALERAVEQTKKGYELTDCDKHSWWEDFKAYSEIKTAEWSEEDKRLLRTTLECLNYVSCQSKTPVVNWLNSLPERFNIQPKQEWSEEDEDYRHDILLTLEALRSSAGSTDTNIVYQHLIDWLKSLRPQPQWKPSEEQIHIIGLAIANLEPTGHHSLCHELEQLKDNLKKL